MRRFTAFILAGLVVIAAGWAAPAAPDNKDNPGNQPGDTLRFDAVHVFVDSGTMALAAYQLSLRATTGNVRIVGIEGSDHHAFSNPPYYDPIAIQGDRVIIGAFSTADVDSLPTGRTRIATIHVQITGGQAEYDAQLTVSAGVDGLAIPGRLTLETESQQ